MNKAFQIISVIAVSFSISGCASINYITDRNFADVSRQMGKPEDLYFHGKTGRIMAAGGYYIAVPVDVVLLPVTYPMSWAIAEWVMGEGWAFVVFPGGIIQTVIYTVGSGIAYPLHLAFESIPEVVRNLTLTKTQIIEQDFKLWPYITKTQYHQIVAACSRTNAPPYRQSSSVAPFGIGAKPCLDETVLQDWKEWQERWPQFAGKFH